MRVLGIIGLAAALAACQTPSYVGDENSPYYVVPAGSRLLLTQALHMDPEQVSLYVQFGKVVRFAQVQKYEAFCKFELFSRVESARTVAPGEIDVIRAFQSHSYEPFARAELPPLAPRGTLLAQGDASRDGGPALQSFIVRMDLRSATQPDIFRMTCGRWAGYPSSYEHLSIAEVRRTLSPLFDLRTPAPAQKTSPRTGALIDRLASG